MTLSLNQRANDLADHLAADADALRVAVRTLDGGARVIDCGAQAAGGYEAGRRFAEICMGGLGTVVYAPQVIGARWLRALGLPVTDEQIEGRYTRWSGDAVELRRAEILILEPPR